MDAPKRNSDRLNTIGIVTVGGVGSALVYLSIVGLQAFYVNDTSRVDEQARFGTQGETRQTLRGEQIGNITEPRAKGIAGPNNTPVYSIPISDAKALIVRDAKLDAANLVPVVGRSDKSLIQPAFGRPQAIVAPPGGAPAPTDGTAVPPPGGASTPGMAPAAADPGATPSGSPPTTAAPGNPSPADGTTSGAANPPPAPGTSPRPADPAAPASPTPAVPRPPTTPPAVPNPGGSR